MNANFSIASSNSQEIVQEIVALEGRILDLRYQLNARAPVSRFPADVVTEIFSWLQQLYGNIFSLSFNPKTFVTWIKVTHVFQNWRRIALFSRQLWTIIPVKKTRYAMTALNRSGASPIYVTTFQPFPSLVPDDKVLWQRILAAAPRIRFLRVGGHSRIQHFDQPLPLLEELSANHGKEVPKAAFSTSLTRLSLTSCGFNWEHFGLRFDKLTRLKVIKPQNKITFDGFVVLLRHMPRLTSLEICTIFPESGPRVQSPTLCDLIGSPIPRPSSDLPMLTSYRASGLTQPAYMQLLVLLRLQPKFGLSLTFKPQRYSQPDIGLALRIINQRIRDSSHTIRAVSCVTGESKGTISYTFSKDPMLRISFLYLSVETPVTDIKLMRWLQELQSFPLDDVEFLSTDGVTSQSDWSNPIFSKLPKLRCLHIFEPGSCIPGVPS